MRTHPTPKVQKSKLKSSNSSSVYTFKLFINPNPEACLGLTWLGLAWLGLAWLGDPKTRIAAPEYAADATRSHPVPGPAPPGSSKNISRTSFLNCKLALQIYTIGSLVLPSPATGPGPVRHGDPKTRITKPEYAAAAVL